MLHIIYMSSSGTDSSIVDSMVAYGRVKATIGLISSIVMAVILLYSAYLASKGTGIQTSTQITGHVVKKEICEKNNNNCQLVVEYTVNGARQLVNTTGPSTTQIGDTITVDNSSIVKKSKNAPYVFVCISILLLGGGIMYYKFVMKNKYVAVYNAFSRY